MFPNTLEMSPIVQWPKAANIDDCFDVCCWGAKLTRCAHFELFSP